MPQYIQQYVMHAYTAQNKHNCKQVKCTVSKTSALHGLLCSLE
uniref:Uncharacterized protein n=2 Tax=Anguilla anguilla TaxID=7936 RepID=A0A0E9VP94_ANGAN